MRIITLHCDHITFKPIKKALKSAPDLNEAEKKEITVKDPLVILTAIEEGDNDATIKQLIESIKKTAGEVKAKNIVLYPYAHLSSNLAKPDTALGYLTLAEHSLKKEGFEVTRAPFGYYKEFELKVKGHPLSELSKEFRSEEQKSTTPLTKPILKEEPVDPSKLLRELQRTKLDTSKLKDNDHRILGQRLDLFSFNEAAPGAVFWHPKGQIIFNELIQFSRELQKEAGYQEISTPQILDNKLWRVSGHWQHYKDNMFITDYEGRQMGAKPMNCPGGMLLFRSQARSYKDLPLRWSEYGSLHRMELSGTLAGLFRVIRFTQDDTHIFCSLDQLPQEIEGVFNLIKKIYKDTFNFDYKLFLSTRPEKYLGDIKDWSYAEETLEKALKKLKIPYTINKGDGAFYGPKIDITILDSQKREWQCGTVQLDMQLPQRFELSYTGADNKEHRPLVIHRAIFGSLERFIGILLEHLNGNLPLWLAPVQVKLINFTDRNTKAFEKLEKQLKAELPQLRVETDLRNTTVNDKIRDAELQKINYMIVLGDKEEEKGTLAVRQRGEKKPQFGVKLPAFIKELKEKLEKRA